MTRRHVKERVAYDLAAKECTNRIVEFFVDGSCCNQLDNPVGVTHMHSRHRTPAELTAYRGWPFSGDRSFNELFDNRESTVAKIGVSDPGHHVIVLLLSDDVE